MATAGRITWCTHGFKVCVHVWAWTSCVWASHLSCLFSTGTRNWPKNDLRILRWGVIPRFIDFQLWSCNLDAFGGPLVLVVAFAAVTANTETVQEVCSHHHGARNCQCWLITETNGFHNSKNAVRVPQAILAEHAGACHWKSTACDLQWLKERLSIAADTESPTGMCCSSRFH